MDRRVYCPATRLAPRTIHASERAQRRSDPIRAIEPTRMCANNEYLKSELGSRNDRARMCASRERRRRRPSPTTLDPARLALTVRSECACEVAVCVGRENDRESCEAARSGDRLLTVEAPPGRADSGLWTTQALRTAPLARDVDGARSLDAARDSSGKVYEPRKYRARRANATRQDDGSKKPPPRRSLGRRALVQDVDPNQTAYRFSRPAMTRPGPGGPDLDLHRRNRPVADARAPPRQFWFPARRPLSRHAQQHTAPPQYSARCERTTARKPSRPPGTVAHTYQGCSCTIQTTAEQDTASSRRTSTVSFKAQRSGAP
jgi:hypothetical protein